MTLHKNATIITVTPSVNGDLHKLLLLKDDGEELELGAAYSPVVVHRDPRKRLPLWTLQPGTLVNVEAPEHALAGWGIQIVEFSPVLEIEFVYTNHEGETRLRKAVPLAVRFEQTEWHGLQMIMVGWDTEKQDERSYALGDCMFKTALFVDLRGKAEALEQSLKSEGANAYLTDDIEAAVRAMRGASKPLD